MKLSELSQEELNNHKKQLKKNSNKKYYETVKEDHKEKMKQYYHVKKNDMIKLYLFINGNINENIINEYNEALKIVDKNKIKINTKIN